MADYTINDAMRDHPDEVRMVMQADGWEDDEGKAGLGWCHSVIITAPDGGDMKAWHHPADTNDAIAAALKWLDAHTIDNGEYPAAHLIYWGLDTPLLKRLLMAVKECREEATHEKIR